MAFDTVADQCRRQADAIMRLASMPTVTATEAARLAGIALGRPEEEWPRLLQSPRTVECGEDYAEAVARVAGHANRFELRAQLFSRATWNERRARGQRKRIEKVEACQTEHYARVCVGCGTVDDSKAETHATRCDAFRYCLSCRGARCAERREQFDGAAAAARKVWRYELERPFRRWGERMLTLTVPHAAFTVHDGDPHGVRDYELSSPGKDVARLHHCWRRYSRRVRVWLAKKDKRACNGGGYDKHGKWRCPGGHKNEHASFGLPLPYMRVMELTGSGEGHAHVHSWLLGPYLPHWVARVEWGKSLGYSDSPYMPVLHISDVLAECLFPFAGPVCEIRTGYDACQHASCQQLRFRRDTASREIQELATARNGRPIVWLPWPVVDVREAKTGVGLELVKYLTKDIGVTGEPMDALEYAELIEATEGRRLICASLSFWLALPPKTCPCCESSFIRIGIERDGEGSRTGGARAPPLH